MSKNKKDDIGLMILGGIALYALFGKKAKGIPYDYGAYGYGGTGEAADDTKHYVSPQRLADLSLMAGDNAGQFARLSVNELMNTNKGVDFSPRFRAKLAAHSDEELRKASSFKEGGSPVQLRDRVPVSRAERKRNLAAIRNTSGFERIRAGTYRKTTGGGIAGGGSVRVIYT